MRKKRFGEYSLPGKVVLLILSAVSLAIIASAERDLHGRAVEDVRGSRRLWQLVSLNALGALAYLRFGRRPRPA